MSVEKPTLEPADSVGAVRARVGAETTPQRWQALGVTADVGMPTMGDDRPAIPRALQREVRVEAGHRCAIPTCRQTSGLQIHHIVDWAKVREHSFDNLILLCANCHSRVTSGEIDTRSVLQYKANLSVMSQRYGDLERRVLEYFAENPTVNAVRLDGNPEIQLRYLLKDGLIVALPPGSLTGGAIVAVHGRLSETGYLLTPSGREFVNRWVSANSLD